MTMLGVNQDKSFEESKIDEKFRQMQTREMQIELKQKDKKIDTLKTQIAEKNERIERLRKQLQGTENQRLND